MPGRSRCIYNKYRPLSQHHRPAGEDRQSAFPAQAVSRSDDRERRLAHHPLWRGQGPSPWVCSAKLCSRTASRLPGATTGTWQSASTVGFGSSSPLRSFWVFAGLQLGQALRDLGLVAAAHRLAPGRPVRLSAETPGRALAARRPPLEVPTPVPEVVSVRPPGSAERRRAARADWRNDDHWSERNVPAIGGTQTTGQQQRLRLTGCNGRGCADRGGRLAQQEDVDQDLQEAEPLQPMGICLRS